jgi:MoaA/NifB/PqqE/SkfB family radical SAM enzyme
MKFLETGLLNLVENSFNQSGPLYVQYYVTARCNLRCEQCNVIYANADRRELNTEGAFSVIDNLSRIGTSVLLLTGGEPFIRRDLPELAGRAIESGIHPRIQTNGLASVKALEKCAELGVRDISISLDSLNSSTQDFLNGQFENSWNEAIETISNIGATLGKSTFAAFGCVFSPFNFREVTKVIQFATEIGFWVSLVPAHNSSVLEPRSFSTFKNTVEFSPSQYHEIDEIIDQIRLMKKTGFNIYDSDQYIDDLQRYVKKEPVTWRSRNDGVCDAGSLYFAVLPDGALAACCDYRLDSFIDVGGDEFVDKYRRGGFVPAITAKSRSCQGCLYGSYPEISISARFAKAAMERVKLFIAESRNEIRILSPDELKSIASKIQKGS